MTQYVFPSLTVTGGGPSEGYSGFVLLPNDLVFTSPLSGSTQALERPGARWKFSARFANLRDPDRAAMHAFVTSLGGQANTFLAFDWARPKPRGIGGGSPIVAGANQTGRSLTISGAPNSLSGWLLPGDYFGVAGELKMVTAATATSSGGAATIVFAPAIRHSPTNGSAITLIRPSAEFYLTNQEFGGGNVRAGGGSGMFQDFALDAVEIFS